MSPLKKVLSMILAGIAAGCLFAAILLILQSKAEDRRAEELFHEHRVPTKVQGSSENENSGSSKEDSADNSSPEETPSDEVPSQDNLSGETASESTEEHTEEIPLTENPYAASYLANQDMAGWLQIPGTTIDYPVMWTPADETYYLYKDFEGNKNQNGCLILDTDSSVDPLSTNLIIHGHNMKSGAMFGNLLKFEDQEYFKTHKKILLYTLKCQRNYEIIAVFRSQVFKKTDQVFKFYQFFQADTEEEFNDFYHNIKALSLYDTGVTAEFGDHFITLSTCVYHVTNGRFVVVAKEVESGDHYLPLTE